MFIILFKIGGKIGKNPQNSDAFALKNFYMDVCILIINANFAATILYQMS